MMTTPDGTGPAAAAPHAPGWDIPADDVADEDVDVLSLAGQRPPAGGAWLWVTVADTRRGGEFTGTCLLQTPAEARTTAPGVSSVRSPSSPGTVTRPAARPAAVCAPRPGDRRDSWLHTVPDGAGTLPPAGQPGRGRAAGMARRELRLDVEVSDAERAVAAAEVTSQGPGGTARASLRAASGHITPGRRAGLVDAVLDLPEVQESARLKVVFPLGDCETLRRLQERCPDVRPHPAGASAIMEANLPVRRSRCSPGRPPGKRTTQNVT